MAIFAVGDLHLSFAVNKPMDRFGPEWVGHPGRLAQAWCESVGGTDTVLLCGDTSWAMRLEDAAPDLAFIEALPGRKVLVRGNHDYWWGSLTKLRRVLPASVAVLQNDSLEVEGWRVCGNRGWTLPGPDSSPDDFAIFERELLRLRLSLESASGPGRRLAMLHFPPYDVAVGESRMFDLLCEFGVEICVYGHLHAPLSTAYPEGMHRGIEFHCVSVDLIGFAPRRIA